MPIYPGPTACPNCGAELTLFARSEGFVYREFSCGAERCEWSTSTSNSGRDLMFCPKRSEVTSAAEELRGLRQTLFAVVDRASAAVPRQSFAEAIDLICTRRKKELLARTVARMFTDSRSQLGMRDLRLLNPAQDDIKVVFSWEIAQEKWEMTYLRFFYPQAFMPHRTAQLDAMTSVLQEHGDEPARTFDAILAGIAVSSTEGSGLPKRALTPTELLAMTTAPEGTPEHALVSLSSYFPVWVPPGYVCQHVLLLE